MSIIIKSNELNTIVYKYLLQAGLSHTAYVMFNEARLQSALQEFKFDIKSGHLLMLLQKALIFSQVQSHVNFGEYNECLEPFYLLKSHTCKITEKIRQQSTSLMKELNNNLVECVKRTNAVYNTELTNKNYEEIVYEPRGMNYFDKFEKLKITDGDVTHTSDKPGVMIDGKRDDAMAVWNKQDNVVYVTRNDAFEDIKVTKIYPCTYDGQLQQLQLMKLTPVALIMIFTHNRVKVINMDQQDYTVEFTIFLQQQIANIEHNPNIANIVTFQTGTSFSIMNLKNMQEIRQDAGMFRWRGFDEYIVFEDGHARLMSLVKEEAILTYVQQEAGQRYCPVDDIEVSANRTFYFVASYAGSKIWVYTFEKEEPLYVFDFYEEEEEVKKVIWVSRNEVDYLCIMTDLAVRVWEVELNAYCLKIDMQKYDLGEIQSIAALEKNDNETYLIALGSENLLVSDIANQKIERIESPANTVQMSNVGKNSVFVLTDENVYFLNGERLTELFK